MSQQLKSLLKQLTPPVLWSLARTAKSLAARKPAAEKGQPSDGRKSQALDIYWDPQMAQLLETWGEGNAWLEIQLLLAGRRGRVLDIACGTGRVMAIVQADAELDVHGCDISDYLISRAVERGLSAEKLIVCDATQLSYVDDFFDFAYSIGSLEHFTEQGIDQVLQGCGRVVKDVSFHMIPVSRSGKDEGWIKPYQAYFNNSVSWWRDKARRVFPNVRVLDSTWSDERSIGKWLVCARHAG